jgi:hypothetical protein
LLSDKSYYNDESSQQKHQTVKDSDSNSTDIQNEAHMYHENSNDTAYDLSDNKERRDAQHYLNLLLFGVSVEMIHHYNYDDSSHFPLAYLLLNHLDV